MYVSDLLGNPKDRFFLRQGSFSDRSPRVLGNGLKDRTYAFTSAGP